jgi:hypothetical protein
MMECFGCVKTSWDNSMINWIGRMQLFGLSSLYALGNA